jgi:peptidyl-prolyl cis-trans isomerase C
MKKFFGKQALLVCFVVIFAVVSGCGKNEEAAKTPVPKDQTQETTQAPASIDRPEAIVLPAEKDSKQADHKGVAVSVDGIVLKKDDLEKKIKAKMNLYKDKIPADKKMEVQEGLKKQLTEEFVMRTVLMNEANNRKIEATAKDIQTQLNQIKANLPADKKLEDFMKENDISKDDIAFGLRVKKLVEMDLGKKAKPSSKEIGKFYDENKEKFSSPETVHVRHILVTLDTKDDEKIKAQKKVKIENLRKQIVEGADFAEVAKNHSDCPSKENGGDLGDIKKGQTVKPFEDAAFSQEINVIGPVVTTEYGHHVIQVLKHNPEKIVKLDEVKDKIALYLEQQKQGEAFSQLAARLRKNAVIIYYEN